MVAAIASPNPFAVATASPRRDELAPPAPERLRALLAFRAPYFEEKMVKERVTRTHDEAARLLDEAKKYLVISRMYAGAAVPMFSRRVDEAWHQLVLFTREYCRFCDEFFGSYVHHAPTLAGAWPDIFCRRRNVDEDQRDDGPRLSFDEFRAAYERLFGPLSDLWTDTLYLARDTRLIRATFRRPLGARAAGDRAELVLWRDPPCVLLRAGAEALTALELTARHESFYVRELPLSRRDDQLDLARALIDARVARMAP